MRIAMVGAKGIPVEAGLSGGIERVVEELAARLVARKHHVSVYVRPYANTSRRTEWEGVRLVTLPCIRLRYVETISHVFFSLVHAIFGNYDIIHIHGVGPSTLAWLPRLFAPKAKVIVTFHARDQFHELNHPVARAVLRWGEWTATHWPHATIAVSQTLQWFCKKELHKDVYFVPNAVSIPPISHVGTDRVEAMGLTPGKYLLGIGRLVQFKAFDVAFRAYKEVKTTMPLAIAGAAGYDIPYAAKLERMADHDHRIHLLGFRTGEDLHQLMAHAYAVVHPSRIEGMSLAVLEGMAYGKLVIMSDIPENREIADHSALCVPVGDTDALADTIRLAIQDPALVRTRGTRARRFVTEHFSWEPVTEQTEAIYRAVAKQGKNR
jgi:glycosyltransferase involved in cell wall biosynthesis